MSSHLPCVCARRLRNIHSSNGDDAIVTAMTFALSRMSHGWPQPRLELLTTVIYFGVSLVLDQSCSNDATRHALQCLADISGGGVEGSQAVSAIGAYALIQRLVHIISHRDYYDQLDPALRTLSNICDHMQAFDPVQAAVNAGILDVAQDFLATGPSAASWPDMVKIINKVASGRKTITQLMIHESLVSNLVYMAMEGNSEWRVRKETIQAVCNIALATDDTVVQALVKHNGVEALVESLYLRVDDGVLLDVLTAVERLFQVGERLEEPYGLMIDQWSGIDRIEALQNHANIEIAALAECILERHVLGSDEGDDGGTCGVYSPECYKFDNLIFGEDSGAGIYEADLFCTPNRWDEKLI
jgi:Atypical Arm repeat